jgi:hypothetical protein
MDIDPAWLAFLDDHPELRGWIMPGGTRCDGSTYPTHYNYHYVGDEHLDRFVLEGLRRGAPEAMTTQEVMAAMYGTLDEAKTSDGTACSEQPQAIAGRLSSLARRGLVERARKRQGTTPTLWRLA